MSSMIQHTTSSPSSGATHRYEALFVNRGPAGGNMVTDAVHRIVGKHQAYTIGKKGLELSPSALYAVDLEHQATHPAKIEVPPYLEVEANWDPTSHESGSGNNILGDNGLLTLPLETLHIPSVEATSERLAYYGATLLKEREVIQFSEAEYPIFNMTVGPRYVDEFLMSEKGGGFYLEYHHDKPHFHMPLQGGGHYILARWNEEKTKLHITGFKIPDGQAVYTKKGAIHCDGALSGNLIVGYDEAHDCSTVLLRTKDNKKTKVEFYQSSKVLGGVKAAAGIMSGVKPVAVRAPMVAVGFEQLQRDIVNALKGAKRIRDLKGELQNLSQAELIALSALLNTAQETGDLNDYVQLKAELAADIGAAIARLLHQAPKGLV